MKLRTAAYLFAGSALLNLLGSRLLDRLGLIEGLLSPSGARLVVLVPVAVVFYAARLFAFFVAPGLLLGAAAATLQLTKGSRHLGAANPQPESQKLL